MRLGYRSGGAQSHRQIPSYSASSEARHAIGTGEATLEKKNDRRDLAGTYYVQGSGIRLHQGCLVELAADLGVE